MDVMAPFLVCIFRISYRLRNQDLLTSALNQWNRNFESNAKTVAQPFPCASNAVCLMNG